MCVDEACRASVCDAWHFPACLDNPGWYRCTSWVREPGCEDCAQAVLCYPPSPPPPPLTPHPPLWPGIDKPLTHVEWSPPSSTEDVPFSKPFELTAQKGKIWIASTSELEAAEAAGELDEATFEATWKELKLKGTNWAGFQSPTACVHALWDLATGDDQPGRNMSSYIDYLKKNHFNAVRLPLNAYVVTWPLRGVDTIGPEGKSANGGGGRDYNTTYRCGRYTGWTSMEILDEVLRRLSTRFPRSPSPHHN